MFLRNILVLLLFAFASSAPQQFKNYDFYKAPKNALGRVASYGDLYDARSDQFVGISIFKKSMPIPISALHPLNPRGAYRTFLRKNITSDLHSNKFSAMDINTELQPTLLTDKLNLTGSARFLMDKKSRSGIIQDSLIYRIMTKEENLDIHDNELKDAYSIPTLEQVSTATHVVTGISWGAISILSLIYDDQYDYDSADDDLAIQTQLQIILRRVIHQRSLQNARRRHPYFNPYDELAENNTNKDIPYNVKLFADILPPNASIPNDIDDVKEIFNQIDNLIDDSYDGKGIPIIYRLTPISVLQKHLHINLTKDIVYVSICCQTTYKLTKLFDQMLKATQDLNEFYHLVKIHKNWITSEEHSDIENYLDKISIKQSDLRSNLSHLLIEVRSGNLPETDIEQFIQDYYDSDISPVKIRNTVEKWKPIKDRIKLALEFESNNITYVSVYTLMEENLQPSLKSFVLFAGKEIYQDEDYESSELWKRNKRLFYQEMKNRLADGGEQVKFMLLDCTIHHCKLPENVTSLIAVFHGKNRIIKNLLDEEESKKAEKFPRSRSTTLTCKEF